MDTQAKCSTVHFNRKQTFFALTFAIITPYILLSGISKDTTVVLRIFTALLAFGTIKLVLWATFFHPWYDAIVTLCICVIVPFKFCIILTTGFSDWFMLSYFPISCCFYIAKDLFVKRMSMYWPVMSVLCIFAPLPQGRREGPTNGSMESVPTAKKKEIWSTGISRRWKPTILRLGHKADILRWITARCFAKRTTGRKVTHKNHTDWSYCMWHFAGFKDNQVAGVVAYGGKLNARPPYQREFIYDDEKQAVVSFNIEVTDEKAKLT